MRADPIRILLASSDPVYAETLADLLDRRGFEVHRLPVGADETRSPALLAAADVLLVETHGLETAEWQLMERLRRAAPLVEVVAISADPEVEDAVLALRSGAFAVLEYSVSADQLAETVAAAAARKRRAEARINQLNHDHPWEREEARLPRSGKPERGSR